MIQLSLIIATYNRATPLIHALESVVEQDADPTTWECVVVNNNSRDDTEERFAEFAARYPTLNLRMVCQKQQGLSHARNCGIAQSTGAIIAIIDDDERINAGFISAYIHFFDHHPTIVAAGGRIIPEYPAGRPTWMSRYVEQPIANPIDLGNTVREFPIGRIPGGGNMALQRSAIDCYGAFDPTLGRTGTKLIGGEESDLFERLARAGERCYYVPEAIMWHIIPPEKLTADYFARLCYNVGVSQRARAEMNHRVAKTIALECAKWGATLAIGAWYAVQMQPTRAAWLIRMRRQISRGLFFTAQP
ncbi:MAG: glycosyltransferase family 2 protein [Alistipes sp.]